MKKFLFKFESLLKLRKNERDLRHQALADLLRRDADLMAARRRVEAERTGELDGMRRLVSPGHVDIDRSASRRYYAGQLIGDLGALERDRALLSVEIGRQRLALIKADQDVKTLEKLEERAKAEFLYESERIEAREIEETWRAVHSGDQRLC